jgi:hypothetical protein
MSEKSKAVPASKAAAATPASTAKSVSEHILPSLAAARKITANLNVAFAKSKR